MNLIDYAQAGLIGLTNRLLKGGDAGEISWFEERAGFAVTRARQGAVGLRFYGADGRGWFYRDWVEGVRKRGARRLRLLELSDFGTRLPKPNAGFEIEDRQLAGFANAHETALGLELPDRTVGLRAEMAYPPSTDLTHRDVLAFIAASPEKDHFRKSMLWQDEHNLHFTDGKDWDVLLAAVTPERDEKFVDAFSTCVSNVAVSKETSARWLKLTRDHETKLSPELRVIEFASVPGSPGAAPGLAAAASSLASALTDCAAYAVREKLDPWDGIFANALAVLNDGSESALDEVFARFYPDDRARLLTAVSIADVFGGMGSWNDLGLDGDPEYARVSENLFRALQAALPAACA
jgi:hypothetical protein